MNTASKTIAAVAAAAAVGGGIVGVNYLSEESKPSDSSAVIDDVVAATVAIPKVELPKVTVYTVKTPAVSLVRIVSQLELDKLNIPHAQTAAVKSANVGGDIVVIPSPEGERIVVPSPGGDIVAVPTPAGYKITVPDVADPAARMPQLIALQKLQQKLFRDQRNLMYDKSIGLDSASWSKWLKIYQTAEPYQVEYKPLRKGLRIISEVKCPEDSVQLKQLDQSLEAYARFHYNAVLLTFDLSEPLYKLADVIDYIKSKEMSVIIAYSGPENLSWSIFKDPDKLEKYLSTLGAKADALLLGWRRTGLHLFLPDRQWTDFLIRSARKLNAGLPVIGQAYLGENAESNGSENAVAYHVPENVSAVLVFGIGYSRVATEAAIKKFFPEIAGLEKIGLVLGERPYFDTLHDTKKSRAENLRIKRDIERRMLYGGCVSTLTLHGDGSDGTYGQKGCTNNLCLPYIKK